MAGVPFAICALLALARNEVYGKLLGAKQKSKSKLELEDKNQENKSLNNEEFKLIGESSDSEILKNSINDNSNPSKTSNPNKTAPNP